MLNLLVALQAALGAFTAFFVGSWWSGAKRAAAHPSAPAEAKHAGMPSPGSLGVGFVTNFFDTLGIGSFAPTTALFKFFKMVPDRLIPGTLNVGHTLPTIVEAFIYTAAIAVDKQTLILMIAASVAGAYLGSGVVASWPKRTVQIGMGSALLVAAALFTYKNLPSLTGQPNLLVASENGTLDLQGSMLVIGLIGNFALGALMTLGIGMYAPSMILVSLLGMNSAAAFPIMMGSCAFLMPVSSARFIKKDAYAIRPSLGLTLGGIPGVLIAAYLVTNMPITAVRWLVIGVVLIAATMMLRSAAKNE